MNELQTMQYLVNCSKGLGLDSELYGNGGRKKFQLSITMYFSIIQFFITRGRRLDKVLFLEHVLNAFHVINSFTNLNLSVSVSGRDMDKESGQSCVIQVQEQVVDHLLDQLACLSLPTQDGLNRQLVISQWFVQSNLKIIK